MSNLSPQVQKRIDEIKATQMTPLIAFPGGALRLSIWPSLVETQVLVEFYRPGSKEAEKEQATIAGNVEQVKLALDNGLLWLARRDGDGKWKRFYERTMPTANNVILPSITFDWR